MQSVFSDLTYEKTDEVKALQKQVQTKYNEAVKSDDKLANMVGGTLQKCNVKMETNRLYAIPITQTTDTESQTQETQATETKKQEETEQYTTELGKEGRYTKERFQEIYRYGQDK